MDDSADNTSQFVEYRNAVYQGGFVKGRRQGKGILITDLGQVFIGEWKNDCLDHKALIWMDEKTYVIGDFNNGQMEGNFIYRDGKTLFYATFAYDRVVGKQLFIDANEERAFLTEFRNSSYEELRNVKLTEKLTEKSEGQIFQELYGHAVELTTLEKFEREVMFKDKSFEEKTLKTGNRFIYFNKCSNIQKLGLVMVKNELVSFGTYKEDVLEGLGYQFTNKTRYEGVFKNGLLNGLGLKYEIMRLSTSIGKFVDGNMVEFNQSESGINKAMDLTDYKRGIHLRSMYFFNSFVQASSLLKYSGFMEITNKYHPQQEYLLPSSPTKSPKKKPSQQPPNITEKISSKLSYRDEQALDNEPISPTKKKATFAPPIKVTQNGPSMNKLDLLLNEMAKGSYDGSVKSNLKAYNDLNNSKAKNKGGFE